MRKHFSSFSRLEKIILLLCSIGFIFAILGSVSIFNDQNTTQTPAYGGTYREGVVAQANAMVLNPLFVYGKRDGTVQADIVSLVFRGLMQFNTQTGKLEDALGEHFLSPDKKTYTFRLKEGLRWHDGHPLTADDVIFTFKDIVQHEDFTNQSLKKAFSDVTITKVNEREVLFTITYPYKFFLTNFTVGLLPKHLLAEKEVRSLEFDNFSSHPIGNGPYMFDELKEMRPNVFRLTLNAFRSSSLADPKLDIFEFWIYPSKEGLSLDSQKLTGIRPFSKQMEKDMVIDEQLSSTEFVLPQYSALFFNLNKPIFTSENGKKLRLGMQLGTDKEALLNIVPAVRIDTPLLETKRGKDQWLYTYDTTKAQGSLKDAGFFLPGKKPKTSVPANSDEGIITSPTEKQEWIMSQEKFLFSGKYPENTTTLKVLKNEKEIIEHKRGTLGEVGKKYLANIWAFDFVRGENFEDGAQVIRIQFFDDQNNLITEDALSLYADEIVVPTPSSSSTPEGEEGEKTATNDTPVREDEKLDEDAVIAQGDASKDDIPTNDTTTEEEPSATPVPIESPSSTPTVTPEPTAIIPKALSGIRETIDGKKLKLTLLTSSRPSYYSSVAKDLQEQWKTLGIELDIKVLPTQEFLDAVSHREYDILLFGQNLGYNLDIYEYFHESQVGKDNLSDYRNPRASVLIQEIRLSHDAGERAKKLKSLQEVLQNDIPAVFLFSPIYSYYSDSLVEGVKVEKISLMKDRFSQVEDWYLKTEKTFSDGHSWKEYPNWFAQKIYHFITFSL